jgi:RimJ/RimL family protein N-acetyltransferase
MRDAKEPSTPDVLLRAVMESDLPVFFEHQRDPEANRMAAFAARDRDAFMAHWSKMPEEDQSVVRKTIVADGQVAGNVVSWEHSGRVEVGYWIGREFWGRGIATRALNAFLREVTTRPLYAHVAAHNVASIRVLEKCGFTISDEEPESLDEPGDGVAEVILKLEGETLS